MTPAEYQAFLDRPLWRHPSDVRPLPCEDIKLNTPSLAHAIWLFLDEVGMTLQQIQAGVNHTAASKARMNLTGFLLHRGESKATVSQIVFGDPARITQVKSMLCAYSQAARKNQLLSATTKLHKRFPTP